MLARLLVENVVRQGRTARDLGDEAIDRLSCPALVIEHGLGCESYGKSTLAIEVIQDFEI